MSCYDSDWFLLVESQSQSLPITCLSNKHYKAKLALTTSGACYAMALANDDPGDITSGAAIENDFSECYIAVGKNWRF